jgi:hypothetical protein
MATPWAVVKINNWLTVSRIIASLLSFARFGAIDPFPVRVITRNYALGRHIENAKHMRFTQPSAVILEPTFFAGPGVYRAVKYGALRTSHVRSLFRVHVGHKYLIEFRVLAICIFLTARMRWLTQVGPFPSRYRELLSSYTRLSQQDS